jgi:hypothetical protein
MKLATKAVVLLGAACLLAPAAQAATSLSVTGAAALEGSYGLNVAFDGAGGNAYVQDNSPSGETTYWFAFLVNDVNVTVNPGGSFQVIRAFTDDAATATAFRINILPPAAGQTNNKVFVLPTLNGGGFHPTGSETFITPTGAPPDDDRFVFEWTSGAGTGVMRTYRDAILRKEILNLNNNTISVGMIRMGGFGNTVSVAAGSNLRLDAFESYRSPITP